MTLPDRIEVHFLNVDHGDCTIIRHSGDEHREKGRITFIDINDWNDRRSKEDEKVAGLSSYIERTLELKSADEIPSPEEYAEEYLDNPLDYFRTYFRPKSQDIWRFIATHPDMDHISGLKKLDDEETIKKFWDIEHNKEMDSWEQSPYNKEDWLRYQEIKKDETEHGVLNNTAGDLGQYWEEDRIEILHPSDRYLEEFSEREEQNKEVNYNKISYVLLLRTRPHNFLFAGDIDDEIWEILIKDHKSKLESVDVLKAAHHGRDTGFHEEAVELMDPDYVILSVGKKPDNDAHQDYVDTCGEDTKVLSTRQHGWIKIWTPGERSDILHVQMREEDGIFPVTED